MKKLLGRPRRRDRSVSYCDSCGSPCDSKCRSESVRTNDVMRATKWTQARIV